MQDMLSELRTARHSGIVAVNEFLKDYSPSGKKIYSFFEGHDDSSFYGNFIEKRTLKNYFWHTYWCGNKKGVVHSFKKIQELRPQAQFCLFFVDKDLGDFLDEDPIPSDIFSTVYYSFENYLVSEQVFRRFLVDVFKGIFPSIQQDKLWQMFFDNHQLFCKKMKIIMAWVLFCRQEKIECNLNNISLNDLFFFDDNLHIVAAKGSRLKSLQKALKPPFSKIDFGKLRKNFKNFHSKNSKEWLRGKWEIWFFVHFFKKLATILTEKKNVSPTIQIECGNASEILGPRIVEPDELKTYLELKTKNAT